MDFLGNGSPVRHQVDFFFFFLMSSSRAFWALETGPQEVCLPRAAQQPLEQRSLRTAAEHDLWEDGGVPGGLGLKSWLGIRRKLPSNTFKTVVTISVLKCFEGV